MSTQPQQVEILIERYIQSGRKNKAVALISRMAVESARHRQFARAETYRDRLYEVDNTALTAILKVNEIISQEKSKSVGADYRRLWPQFFKNLSVDEANDFFISLSPLDMIADQTICKQASENDRLYFVKSGGVKIVHENQEKEQLIGHLSSGRLFGANTFFSVNVCTVSVICLFPGRLLVLDKRRLERLRKNYPDIEEKLHKICSAEENITGMLRKKGIDRRIYRRINLQARIKVQVLTPEARNSLRRPIPAELWDISKNGLSFYMRSKNKEAVRRLIGRTLGIELALPANGKTKKAFVTGVVHGVQNHPLDDYSIHIKLSREFSHRALQTIRMIAAKQS